MDNFTKAYIECLEWIKSDEEFSLSSEDFEQIERDCRIFQVKASKWMADLDEIQCGHDFYLTRNGHGCGFWDRGYDQAVSRALCEISKEFGESFEGF